eukprot:CAMPEP_0118978130 /NCGR_PEP_ID=MMETSP1173-20130426/22967_1 /TAXON_ID=1034831 /ORGANISM="Rhizochromulina marina cf, Strain CCMP1243" /LENGTH=70 /DNA_ID=CAMNT_0006928307 /DNA_START=7 /DNA_END=216 /DNA_ORIENTATION=+
MSRRLGLVLACCWLAGGAAAASIEEDLVQWFTDHGGKLHGVTIAEFDGMGRGVQATRDLNPKDPIIDVPL